MQLDLDFQAPLTVSELTRRIKDTLETGFADVWVVGEISGLRIPSSGHLYFSLKDKGANIKCVFFRSGSRFLRFRPEDGLEVILRGRLSVYEPRGEYQIIAEYMEPKGLGALQLAFIQMKEKLEKDGLFDPARKRPLPPYPKCIGVVTSPTGAAVRDILKVLKRRAPGVHVIIAPASVQGESAPAEVARAIEDLNRRGGLDVLIVGRGGGSLEDLAAFNTEVVARAIFNSNIPVISAVGHEIDFTIADFVADLRAPTPSAAAEIVAKSEEELRHRLEYLRNRVCLLVGSELRHMRARLNSEVRALPDPRKLMQERMLRVDNLMDKAGILAARSVERNRQRFEQAVMHLNHIQPLAPLSRGFALAMKLPGLEIIKDAPELEAGELFRLRFKSGEMDCRVESIRSGFPPSRE